jgi:hypothetical protein
LGWSPFKLGKVIGFPLIPRNARGTGPAHHLTVRQLKVGGQLEGRSWTLPPRLTDLVIGGVVRIAEMLVAHGQKASSSRLNQEFVSV